jgi:hypothetical protein
MSAELHVPAPPAGTRPSVLDAEEAFTEFYAARCAKYPALRCDTDLDLAACRNAFVAGYYTGAHESLMLWRDGR